MSERAVLQREHEIAGGKYTLRTAAVAVPLHGVFEPSVVKQRNESGRLSTELLYDVSQFELNSTIQIVAYLRIVLRLRASLATLSHRLLLLLLFLL